MFLWLSFSPSLSLAGGLGGPTVPQKLEEPWYNLSSTRLWPRRTAEKPSWMKPWGPIYSRILLPTIAHQMPLESSPAGENADFFPTTDTLRQLNLGESAVTMTSSHWWPVLWWRVFCYYFITLDKGIFSTECSPKFLLWMFCWKMHLSNPLLKLLKLLDLTTSCGNRFHRLITYCVKKSLLWSIL